MAFQARHQLQYLEVDLAPAAKQNLASCIARLQDQYSECRGALGGLEEVVRHWSIVFVLCSLGGSCDHFRETVRMPYLCFLLSGSLVDWTDFLVLSFLVLVAIILRFGMRRR